jgi:hypothetical protein
VLLVDGDEQASAATFAQIRAEARRAAIRCQCVVRTGNPQ